MTEMMILVYSSEPVQDKSICLNEISVSNALFVKSLLMSQPGVIQAF